MSEDREEKELREFDAWFKCCAGNIIPTEEDIPPKHYKKYKSIAFAAWQEVMCRARLNMLKEGDV